MEPMLPGMAGTEHDIGVAVADDDNDGHPMHVTER
jgi:hypothetical protein